MAKKGYTIINFSLDTDRGNPAGGRAQNVLTDFQVTELGFVAVWCSHKNNILSLRPWTVCESARLYCRSALESSHHPYVSPTDHCPNSLLSHYARSLNTAVPYTYVTWRGGSGGRSHLTSWRHFTLLPFKGKLSQLTEENFQYISFRIHITTHHITVDVPDNSVGPILTFRRLMPTIVDVPHR